MAAAGFDDCAPAFNISDDILWWGLARNLAYSVTKDADVLEPGYKILQVAVDGLHAPMFLRARGRHPRPLPLESPPVCRLAAAAEAEPSPIQTPSFTAVLQWRLQGFMGTFSPVCGGGVVWGCLLCAGPNWA